MSSKRFKVERVLSNSDKYFQIGDIIECGYDDEVYRGRIISLSEYEHTIMELDMSSKQNKRHGKFSILDLEYVKLLERNGIKYRNYEGLPGGKDSRFFAFEKVLNTETERCYWQGDSVVIKYREWFKGIEVNCKINRISGNYIYVDASEQYTEKELKIDGDKITYIRRDYFRSKNNSIRVKIEEILNQLNIKVNEKRLSKYNDMSIEENTLEQLEEIFTRDFPEISCNLNRHSDIISKAEDDVIEEKEEDTGKITMKDSILGKIKMYKGSYFTEKELKYMESAMSKEVE